MLFISSILMTESRRVRPLPESVIILFSSMSMVRITGSRLGEA
jgi:hypothetical protein